MSRVDIEVSKGEREHILVEICPRCDSFAMEYRELEPAATLRHLVRCYWMLTSDPGEPMATPEPVLPDGSPELIFNAADPFLALDQSLKSGVVQPFAMLVGQITGPFTVGPTGRVDLIAVRFQSCGGALVCDDLSAITDRWVDIDQLPRPELASTLGELTRAASTEARAEILNHTIARLIGSGWGPDPEVLAATRAISASQGMVVLEELATSLHCSLRHLQRRFSTQVGISPKLLARIRRCQRVFHAWRDDPRSLSRVAVECGYFDQSHLIRDFRELAGAAPAAFLANQPEFTQFFLPTSRAP
ncbi:MAG: helix-turn-helix transcriptional regulator [Gemmatimonas sp.]